MKRIILIFMVTFLMGLTGCSQGPDIKDDVLSIQLQDAANDAAQTRLVMGQ